MSKKANGEDSVYQIGAKRKAEGKLALPGDGRWAGSAQIGYGPRQRSARPDALETTRRRVVVYGRTKEEVRRKLQAVRRNLDDGILPVDQRTTLRNYLEQWLQTIEPRVMPSTFTRYKQLVAHQLVPALGHIKLAALTSQAVERMLADLQKGGLSPRTVHHVRAALRTALQDGVRLGVVARNAAGLARGPKVEDYSVKAMSPTHAGAILDVFAGSDLLAPVATALWTGARQGEILALIWDNIDLNARLLTVTATLQRRGGAWHIEPTKTAKSRRTVSIPAPLVDVLSEHRQRQREARLLAGPVWDTSFGDLVFTGPKGQPFMASSLTHCFHDAQVRAGLSPVRFHDLRHAAATLMLASGVDLKVVSELLGHSKISTTADVYTKVLDELKVDAADRMTRLMSR
jgi:integrase